MLPSRVFAFTDLDDTLIQTERKLPKGVKTEVGAHDRQGNPLSYFTRRQQTLLAMLERAEATIIPVTGRNKEALNRATYPFTNYSAVSHGAVVLTPGGTVCPKWSESLNAEGEDWEHALRQANQDVQRWIEAGKLDARTRVIIDQGIYAYVSVKGTDAALTSLNPVFRDSALRIHLNGRNAALLPPYACKRRAVEHIGRELDIQPDDLVMGLGDSLTDVPFLRVCQFAVFPTGSQIDKELVAR